MFVAFDAHDPSLPGLFRSLNLEPECREALVKLAEEVRQLAEQRDHEAEFEAMVTRAKGLPVLAPAFRQPKPKRDRHGMHIVRAALPLAAAAAFFRSHARHAIVTAAVAAIGAAGALSPDLIPQAPAAQVPHVHHALRHHRAPGLMVPVVVVPPRRRRRPDRDADDMAKRARPSPSATVPGPGPSPAVTPLPLPSVTPPPAPSPVPTCIHLTGHHCHDGDLLEGVRDSAGPFTATIVNHAPVRLAGRPPCGTPARVSMREGR